MNRPTKRELDHIRMVADATPVPHANTPGLFDPLILLSFLRQAVAEIDAVSRDATLLAKEVRRADGLVFDLQRWNGGLGSSGAVKDAVDLYDPIPISGAVTENLGGEPARLQLVRLDRFNEVARVIKTQPGVEAGTSQSRTTCVIGVGGPGSQQAARKLALAIDHMLEHPDAVAADAAVFFWRPLRAEHGEWCRQGFGACSYEDLIKSQDLCAQSIQTAGADVSVLEVNLVDALQARREYWCEPGSASEVALALGMKWVGLKPPIS